MFFSKATKVALITAFPLVLGKPILETRQNGVTCQTSSGSPDTGDVTDVINQLNGYPAGSNCSQSNGHASGKSYDILNSNYREADILTSSRLYHAPIAQECCNYNLWRSGG